MQTLDGSNGLPPTPRIELSAASQSAYATIGMLAFCKMVGVVGMSPVEVAPQPANVEAPVGIELATGRPTAVTVAVNTRGVARRN